MIDTFCMFTHMFIDLASDLTKDLFQSQTVHTHCSFLTKIQMCSLPDVGHAVTDKSVQCMHNNLNQDDRNSEDDYYVFNIYYFYYLFFTLQYSMFYCLTIKMRL